MQWLALRLRGGVSCPTIPVMDEQVRARRFAEINERARRAFLEGAAEEWTRTNERPPTREELERLLRRYPGDPMVNRGPRRNA